MRATLEWRVFVGSVRLETPTSLFVEDDHTVFLKATAQLCMSGCAELLYDSLKELELAAKQLQMCVVLQRVERQRIGMIGARHTHPCVISGACAQFD